MVGTNGVTFGERPTYTSIPEVAYERSDDKKAFTLTLQTGIAAGVGTPGHDGLVMTGAPVNTRTYSAVIPATGGNLETTFYLTGSGSTEPGTNTKVVLTVNDQHTVTHFGPREEDSFSVSLPFRAEASTDIRITVVVIAERDAAHPDATALIIFNSISADAMTARSEPGGGAKTC